LIGRPLSLRSFELEAALCVLFLPIALRPIPRRPSSRPVCLHRARKYGAAVTHLFETHIHADFMSGARELSRRLGSVPV